MMAMEAKMLIVINSKVCILITYMYAVERDDVIDQHLYDKQRLKMDYREEVHRYMFFF